MELMGKWTTAWRSGYRLLLARRRIGEHMNNDRLLTLKAFHIHSTQDL